MAYSLSNGGVIINDSREIVNAGVVTAISFHGDGSNLTGVITATSGGDTTIGGDALITGNLNVSGISTVDFLNASDVNVGGALTVTGNLSGAGISADDFIGSDLLISGISTLGTVKIADGQITATSGVVTYFGDGSQLTGIDITDSDVRLRNLRVTGVSTLSGDVSLGANASLTGDLLTGRNANLSGIATVNDIYINNLLYDSNDNVGAAGSILATVGGKLQWVSASSAGVATVFEPGNTFYVAKNGNDDQDGLSPEKSFSTISYALSQISNGTNQVLYVAAGEYEETFPLSVPDGLTVKGAGQRSVLVKPTSATETNDGFQLGNASTIEDLTIGQMFKPNGAANNNYAFTFRSGATISSRGPYLSRITILNKGSVTSASDPFGYGSADAYPTTAPGGAGVLADGSVLNSASLEASFLLNEVTTFTAGNIGIDMVNGARVEWLNGFSYFASEGVKGRADQTTGLYGAGKTRLRLDNASGGLINGNTVELYDIDNVTGIATGTIDSTSGSYTFLTDGGTGTFTEAGTRRAKAVAFVDTASLSTTQAKFGVSSLDVTGASTDCINVDPSSDFGFGTGDFTVEFWLFRTSATAGATILDMRDSAAADSALSIRENTSDVIEVLIGNSVVLTSSASAISNSTWHHIAVARQGSTLDLFVDGAQEDTGTQSDDLGLSQSLTFGADYANTNGTIAYLDELRIEKGAAKYTVPFTPSSTELQGDRGTAVLLHLNGINGATTTTDDIEIFQDIRISGGNTADKLTLADYSQFGAEMRSSGCAVEYGNKGVVGDGAGVSLRLIGINFSFVGALGDLTNDPNLAVQANEITEINNAEVSYTSIDQGGDFRVGESFYVNQETGDVSFNNTTTDLTSLSSLTITDGSNSSLITPTSGRFGNVQISGQQVASVAGDLDLVTAGAGEVNIYGNTNIVGVLTAQVIAINSVQNGDTSIALDDTGTDGTIRFNTDGTEAGRFTNTNSLQVTNDITAGRNLQASGIATIGGLLDVNGDILGDSATNISGINSVTAANFYGDGSGLTNLSADNVNLTGTDQSLRNLTVTGLSTFGNNVQVTGTVDATAFVGDGSGLTGVIGSGGSGSIAGNLTVQSLDVSTGVSTFASDINANGNIVGDTATNISGINSVTATTLYGAATLTTVSADSVTVSGDINANGNIVGDTATNISGINSVTATTLYGDGSGLTDISASNVDLSGTDQTFNTLQLTGAGVALTATNGANIGGDLSVTGTGSVSIAGSITLQPAPTGVGGIYFDDSTAGIGTLIVLNDAGVNGNLGVVGDALIDGNIVGNGGTISGYNDIASPLVRANLVSSLQVDCNFLNGADVSVVGVVTVASDIVANGNIVGDTATNISGINSVTATTYYGDGSQLTGVDITGTDVSVNSIVVSGISTLGVVTGATYFGDASNLSDLPPASITTSTTPTVRANGDTLQSGDLWYDSSELRQYTYYNDGGSSQWVPSTPEATIPGFAYAGNTGIGTLTLGEGTFSVVGDGTNVVTTVSGVTTTVTISLSSDVAIAGSMTANAFYGDGSNLTGIDITGSDISVRNVVASGIVTAGSLTATGNITANENILGDGATNISGIASVTSNFYYGDGSNLTGVIGSGGNGVITGNLTVTGTVDAGLVDADDLVVSAGATFSNVTVNSTLTANGNIVGDTATNISGINSVTATTLYGDGSNLTNISATNVNLTGTDQSLRNLTITGVSTFTGITTTVGAAFVGTNLSVLGTVEANNYNSTSDATKKENVAEIDDALAKVLDLRGVTFDWKNGEGSSAGVLAQEVQKVLPSIVDGEEGNMSVQYNGIIALLLEAVKELSAEVEHLKATKSDKRKRKSS